MTPALWDTDETDPPTPESAAPRRSRERQPPPPVLLRPGIREPSTAGAPALDRAIVLASLEAVLSDFAAGKADADELYRSLRGCLWVLSSAELVRVARGLVNLLRVQT